MKCKLVQRRLLCVANPDRVPATLRAHLAGCETCREWQEQLVLLERHVPEIPIPSSKAKTRLLRRILESPREPAAAGSGAGRDTISLAHSSTLAFPRSGRPGRPRLKAGVAAAVLLLGVGWWASQKWLDAPGETVQEKPGIDPLLASLVERDVRLATANTPGERLEILADVADVLQRGTNALAQSVEGEQLATLATLYQQVIQEGVVKQAQAIPAAERQRILHPIALRLVETANQIESLTEGIAPEFAQSLQAIAAAAREGHRQLRALLTEVKA
jgi:hypothetical protein